MPLALDENNITVIGNGISCWLVVFVTRLCLGIFDTNKGNRNTKKLSLPMPLGINEFNHKKNIKEPKSSQTENLLQRLNLVQSKLASHPAAQGQFPAFPKIYHRKNFWCCWGWLTALVRGKWTVAWKCWLNHRVLASGKLEQQKRLYLNLNMRHPSKCAQAGQPRFWPHFRSAERGWDSTRRRRDRRDRRRPSGDAGPRVGLHRPRGLAGLQKGCSVFILV